ncbi:CRISPR system precrRNA processing endoribonuclease RAMP protein Cas6 [Thiothrix eikelboomii]|uniref:CRISPR system precrRNA processing endoribonuclease RAMP protein Cas6 n=1 Tax=Thiothrix eikelboomii TaxID=92487 RepID=UPI003BAF11BB
MLAETPASRLTFAEYRFLFRAIEVIEIPEFSGSLWRGAFGHALKQLHCCQQRLHTPDCLYARLFEPPMPEVRENAGILRSTGTFPVPYVFRVQRQPARQLQPGDWFSVKLLLVAQANQYVRAIIETLQHAARQGLGKGRGRARLQEVVQWPVYGNASVLYADDLFFRAAALEPLICPEPATAARVHFLTPVNLGDHGESFVVERFLMGVVRRVSLLHRFYTDAPLAVDFGQLKQQASRIHHQANVWSGGWQRYSSRQQSVQPVYGWLGDVFLQGAELADFWPYLHLGQWLHTGKSTNMGLGRYELQRVILDS